MTRAFGNLNTVNRQPADLGGGRLAALSQLPHFRRNYCKALAMLAGARRFDGCVQGEQICFASDLFNDADLLGNLLHSDNSTHHRVAAGASVFRGFGSNFIGLACVISVLLNAGRYFFH